MICDNPVTVASVAGAGFMPDSRLTAADPAQPDAGMSSIFDAIDMPIIVVGRNLAVTSFNIAAGAALRITPADIGRPSCEINLLNKAADFQALCERVIEDGLPVRREIRDGYRWFVARIAPYATGGVHTDGAIITLTNVTAFRESIDKAIYEREYTKVILNTVFQPLVVLDAQLKVQTANSAFYTLLQITREQAHGVPLPDLGKCDWKERDVWASLKTSVTDKSTFQAAELECDFPSIGRRTVMVNASPMPFEGAARMLLVFNDITDRKRIEAALRDTDRRKNEFLATLAHELRNPLAPIQNVVQVFRMAEPGEMELKWGREVIDRQVQHLVRLVDDLMDLARITQGKIDLQLVPIAISEVISGAVETSRPLIDARAHELTITVPHRPLLVNGDLIRLAQVVANLLNNSAKYTPTGGKITLAVETQDGEVLVRVSDNGVGIAEQMLSAIFEMFTQAENTASLTQGGLGIGLTLAQRLTQLHTGRIEAKSEGIGKGSEFVLHLPLHNAVKDAQAPCGARGNVTAAFRSPQKILVADDNRDAADTLAMLLKMAGHTVSIACDGLEAVEKAASDRPDVIFLDIGMPRLDGYEAARRIRAEGWGEKMTLIALTGWGQEEDKRRAIEAGFSHHLVKPIDFAALEALF
ncbi:MAG: luxQ 2 [Betaproteobacteria bacterium]|nr:luxQ 2 [Betaproteobacteria bacterium]